MVPTLTVSSWCILLLVLCFRTPSLKSFPLSRLRSPLQEEPPSAADLGFCCQRNEPAALRPWAKSAPCQVGEKHVLRIAEIQF